MVKAFLSHMSLTLGSGQPVAPPAPVGDSLVFQNDVNYTLQDGTDLTVQ